MHRCVECRPLRTVLLAVCMFICIPMLAAGSSIQHIADEPVRTTYDGTPFQPASANGSTYFQPAPDLPTMTTYLSGNQYRLLSNTNCTTKSTEPVFDGPKYEYTYKGENHSHSEGDDSNQRHLLFIDYNPYFALILKKKRRCRKKSHKTGTRKKEVATEQDHSSNEEGTEQHNSHEQTPRGNVHFPVMEESVQLSIGIHRGGNSKSDVMVIPSQNPKAQADQDESSSERSTDIWVVDSIEAENTCAVDELVTPKLKTVLGTHVFNGSVVHENNIATEDMGSVVKPFYELGPPPEKELCNYITTWYANAVPTA